MYRFLYRVERDDNGKINRIFLKPIKSSYYYVTYKLFLAMKTIIRNDKINDIIDSNANSVTFKVILQGRTLSMNGNKISLPKQKEMEVSYQFTISQKYFNKESKRLASKYLSYANRKFNQSYGIPGLGKNDALKYLWHTIIIEIL